MIHKIIHIDEEKCNGCGMCSTACPEVFELNDAGKAAAMRLLRVDGQKIEAAADKAVDSTRSDSVE